MVDATFPQSSSPPSNGPDLTNKAQGAVTPKGSVLQKLVENLKAGPGKNPKWLLYALLAIIIIVATGAIIFWGFVLALRVMFTGDPSNSSCAVAGECYLKDGAFSNTMSITNADWVLERIKPHNPKKERIQQIIDESRKAEINPAILISFWAGEQTFGNEEKAFGCGHYKEGGDDRGFENQLKCAIPAIKDAMNNTGEYTDPEGENIWTRLIYNYVAAAKKQLYDEQGYVTGSSESRISILKKLEPSKGAWVECASNSQCNISGGCQIEGPNINDTAEIARHEKRTFYVTAYCPPATGYDRIEGGQTTASGINVGMGAVAVPPFSRPNPNINGDSPDYPWGTTFIIEGYGTGVALDHGCAIQKANVAATCKSGNWGKTPHDHIDLFVGNGKEACANWERSHPDNKMEIDVYWFKQSSMSKYYYKKVKSFTKRTCTSLANAGSSIVGACAQKIINIAKQEVGYRSSGGDCNKYSGSCLPWCAAFASWVYKQAGYLSAVQPSTVALKSDYSSKLQVVRVDSNLSNVRPGDIFWTPGGVFSGWHVGIIESASNGIVHTIEGNTGRQGKGKNHVDGVNQRTHKINDIKWVARPISCK